MDWWRALLGGTCVATVGGEDDGLDCTKSKQLTRFVGGANITINTSRSRRSVEGGLCLCHFMTRNLSPNIQSVPERPLHSHKTPAGATPARA